MDVQVDTNTCGPSTIWKLFWHGPFLHHLALIQGSQNRNQCVLSLFELEQVNALDRGYKNEGGTGPNAMGFFAVFKKYCRVLCMDRYHPMNSYPNIF